LQSPVRSSDPNSHVSAAKPINNKREALRRAPEAAMRCAIKSQEQFVKPLIASVDGIAEARQNRLRREPGVALSCLY
jgi:hypothetical protein